jgi:hypothetical protein
VKISDAPRGFCDVLLAPSNHDLAITEFSRSHEPSSARFTQVGFQGLIASTIGEPAGNPEASRDLVLGEGHILWINHRWSAVDGCSRRAANPQAAQCQQLPMGDADIVLSGAILV